MNSIFCNIGKRFVSIYITKNLVHILYYEIFVCYSREELKRQIKREYMHT